MSEQDGETGSEDNIETPVINQFTEEAAKVLPIPRDKPSLSSGGIRDTTNFEKGSVRRTIPPGPSPAAMLEKMGLEQQIADLNSKIANANIFISTQLTALQTGLTDHVIRNMKKFLDQACTFPNALAEHIKTLANAYHEEAGPDFAKRYPKLDASIKQIQTLLLN